MKFRILYTKGTPRGFELMVGFGSNAMPSVEDLRDHYEVVAEGCFLEEEMDPDDLFRIFNGADSIYKNPLASADGQNKIKELRVSHTSMSVGDIVVMDNETYLCRPAGWTKMKLDEETLSFVEVG